MLVAFLVAGLQVDPPLAELPAVILEDVRRDAAIGRGDAVLTPGWVLGRDRTRPPEVRVETIGKCREISIGKRCGFTLVRIADSSAAEAERDLPTQLVCTIEVAVLGEGSNRWWHVIPAFRKGGAPGIGSRCRPA